MRLTDQRKLDFKVILVIVLISGMIGALYVGLFRYNKPMDILQGIFVGMRGFGASAPGEELYKHFGITAVAVEAAAHHLIGLTGKSKK